MNSYKFIDLCCGIGSFHYSFRNLGWECVLAADIDPTVRQTYYANYGVMPKGDIYDIDPSNVPEYDILCAGFPCQPFSQAGFGKGFKDERGHLFFKILEFLNINNPNLVLLENVPHLLRHDNGNTWKIIRSELEKRKYFIDCKVLTASDYGIPQRRKRLFVIASKYGCPSLSSIKKELTPSLSNYLGKTFERNVAFTIRCGGRRSPIQDRHNWDGYWIQTEDGRVEYRLTVDDAVKLQGFPSTFKWATTCLTKKWKMLGNTIPTCLSGVVAKLIDNHYKEMHQALTLVARLPNV